MKPFRFVSLDCCLLWKRWSYSLVSISFTISSTSPWNLLTALSFVLFLFLCFGGRSFSTVMESLSFKNLSSFFRPGKLSLYQNNLEPWYTGQCDKDVVPIAKLPSVWAVKVKTVLPRCPPVPVLVISSHGLTTSLIIPTSNSVTLLESSLKFQVMGPAGLSCEWYPLIFPACPDPDTVPRSPCWPCLRQIINGELHPTPVLIVSFYLSRS